MVVILDEGDYDAWLDAPVSETRAFLRHILPKNLQQKRHDVR